MKYNLVLEEAEPTMTYIEFTSFQRKLRFTWEQLLGSHHLACAASIAVLEVTRKFNGQCKKLKPISKGLK
jgi:hypothetical protein